jgi:hypothetical protein
MDLLAVWLMAAFIAAVMSFAPNSAFAHEGHGHHGPASAHQGATAGDHDAARLASASTSPASQVRPSNLTFEKAFASVAAPVVTPKALSSCDGTCCNWGGCGAGCCAAVCTIAEGMDPRSALGSAKLRLPIDLTVAGKRPSSLLEPPTAHA